MTITDHPLHRSQRAELPHWAPASGHDGKALFGIGVSDARRRQQLVPEILHAPPRDPGFVAPSLEGPLPMDGDALDERAQRRTIPGHAI